MMASAAQSIIDAAKEKEGRLELAKKRIESASNGNEMCNGIRLMQLSQIRQAIDKLNPKELFEVRQFFLLACAQPVEE